MNRLVKLETSNVPLQRRGCPWLINISLLGIEFFVTNEFLSANGTITRIRITFAVCFFIHERLLRMRRSGSLVRVSNQFMKYSIRKLRLLVSKAHWTCQSIFSTQNAKQATKLSTFYPFSHATSKSYKSSFFTDSPRIICWLLVK